MLHCIWSLGEYFLISLPVVDILAGVITTLSFFLSSFDDILLFSQLYECFWLGQATGN